MCEWGTDKLITLNRPREHSGFTVIAVDACIADEVQRINDQGIATEGCCCGHGKAPAHVLIDPSSVELAQSLGYNIQPTGTDGPYPSIRLQPEPPPRERERERAGALSIGTRSLLFGAHQFILHPFFLAVAWWRLYGLPLDPRLWIAFLVHDWGYWGKPNMDGDEGQRHPELGGRIMAALFGTKWGDFTRLHSRHYAKLEGREPSPLCAADKLVLLVTPRWLYLPLVQLSGEADEYRALFAAWKGVPDVTLEEWYDGLRAHWLKEVCRLAPHTAFAQRQVTP